MFTSDIAKVVLVLLAAPLILLYVVPGIIASYRGHPQRGAIWLVTLLTGWTGVGWLAALIWAFVAPAGAGRPGPGGATAATPSPQDTNRWAFFLHLSLLAGHVVPLAGFIAPIVIWQVKRDELPGLDVHGRNAANWIISELIYAGAAGVLVVLLIGIPILMALAFVTVLFPIVAAVKAIDGKIWSYPLAMPFLR
jgi:uncharacterized Tic20 family protein